MPPRTGAHILLRLLVEAFVPYGPVVLALETPIERRWGQSFTNSLLTHQDGNQLAHVSGAALIVQNAAGGRGITLRANGWVQAIKADISSSIGIGGNAAVNGPLTATTVTGATLNVTSNARIGGNLTVNGRAAANTGSFETVFLGGVQVKLTASGGQIPDGFKLLIVAG